MERSTIHKIEIYDFDFEVAVTTDIAKSQKDKERRKRLGDADPVEFQGLTWYKGRNLAVIFSKPYLTHGLIAHEIFHAGNRIMQYIGHEFDNRGQEPYACLFEHLTNLVYKDLKRWNIRVK